jgi:hypothetical protein
MVVGSNGFKTILAAMTNHTFQIRIGATACILVICCIGLVAMTGCKGNGKQKGKALDFDNHVKEMKLPKSDVPNNSCGSRCDSETAVKQLIKRLSSEATIQLLQTWCLERLAEPSHVPPGVVRVLETVPESLEVADPQHGNPTISIWHDASEIGPSVMFSWQHAAGDSWGLLVSKPEFKPTAPWLNFQKLQPGVFAFFSSLKKRGRKGVGSWY